MKLLERLKKIVRPAAELPAADVVLPSGVSPNGTIDAMSGETGAKGADNFGSGTDNATSAGDNTKGNGNIGTGTAGTEVKDKATSASGRSVLSSQCPYCQSQNLVKRGTRQKKGGKTQLYICKDCGRTFTPSWTKGRQHGWGVVLEALSYYNLGFSLAQVSQILKEKFQAEVQPSTIGDWVEKNKELCSYHRMRSFAVKHFSPYEVMETCTLAHRQLYRFRYHRAKIKYIMEDDFKHYKFRPLKEFLDNVTAETPHQYFSEGERMSEAKIKFSKTEMIVRAKENYATKLTELVFRGVSENKARHEALQRFLIANDTVTVATEVPVYIKREDLAHMRTQLGFEMYLKSECDPAAEVALPSGGKSPRNKKTISAETANAELRAISEAEIPKLITGHIDFLQIRNGSVHIMDYKGEGAVKVRPIEQLTLYALALSRLTGLRLYYFKCAWFDEKDYFEFFPLHVVYKPGRGRKKIYTKEGTYNMNERMDKMESLKPINERKKFKPGKPNF